MKREPFFLLTVQELQKLYELFWNDSAYSCREKCAAGATAFIYHDDDHLIRASKPDKVRIVMAVAVFLINNGFSKELLTEQMYEDLSWTLKENMVKKFKHYYYKDDYKFMRESVRVVAEWLEGEKQ